MYDGLVVCNNSRGEFAYVHLTFNPCKGESYQATVGYLRLTQLAKGR